MEEAGFVNVVEKKTRVPVGKWAKDKRMKEWGVWNQARLDKGLGDFAARRLKTVMNVSFVFFTLRIGNWELGCGEDSADLCDSGRMMRFWFWWRSVGRWSRIRRRGCIMICEPGFSCGVLSYGADSYRYHIYGQKPEVAA